jgi:ADP-ribosyl-[dinitrogen reductase] hydrolase
MAAIKRSLDTNRVAGSLKCMLVGDALSVPVHWYYSASKLREEYGELKGMVAPKPKHAESMIQGMEYQGTIDILHDKAIYYSGNTVLLESLLEEDVAARRDDHGNFVGVTAEDRVHYHQSLVAGQNTVNACVARLAMRYIGETNAHRQDRYDPDEFLERFRDYMITPPSNTDDNKSQVSYHNDTYLDIYLRGFFTNASNPNRRLRDCAWSQRDTWSIGSLDGVLMAIPIIAAYSDEPESMVIGRAMEHAMLTHKSVTVFMVLSILTPLLLELYHGAELKEALERAMGKMRPPACTGREMRESYIRHHGPGKIPKHEKWLQHMTTAEERFFPEFMEQMLALDNDEDVGGWGDRPNSRLATACYCEQAFSIVLYLSYKYRDDPKKALLQNAMMGGVSSVPISIVVGKAF